MFFRLLYITRFCIQDVCRYLPLHSVSFKLTVYNFIQHLVKIKYLTLRLFYDASTDKMKASVAAVTRFQMQVDQ